ncbi:MAG: sensor histidine kinase [Planctomycetota bacterium]|nr:MAG: sensor histidine kinase [Planctomycetota bacterium]
MTESRKQAVAPPTPSDEKVKFVADARLISILGEQLIGSEKVGILELVKNAYDAGASVCGVTLEGVPGFEPDTRRRKDYKDLPGPIIEVADDGSGMSHEDLVAGWLRPATTRRARIKEQLRAERESAAKRGSQKTFDALVDRLKEAHGGRLPLGEKGIGRLATHRLGRFLWLRTKTRDDALEWELKIDWSRFESLDGAPIDLHDVELTLRHQPPTADYGAKGSGTVICCYGGRPGYQWTREQIVDVGRSVNALRSPRRAPEGFEPRFSSPHVSEHELASPLERVAAPFDLLALVDEEGKADLELAFIPPAALNESLRPFKHQEKLDLRGTDTKYWKADGTTLRRPECGPFILHARAWLRFREWLDPEFKEVTDYLDQFGGITIYRDGLATLPAQQSAKVDWLGLAIAQIKKSSNISYYHLAGEIELAQERTLALRDRSSREGMIETRAYRDLARLTRSAVDQLQFHMQRVREDWTKAKSRRIPPKTLLSHAQVAAGLGKAMVESYDFRKDPLKIAERVGGKNAPERIGEAAEVLLSLGEHLKLQDDEREGLLEAAGFGLAIGVAVHELGKLASAIVTDVRQLHDTIGANSPGAPTLDSIVRRADALLGEVKRLAPLRVTRAEMARPFSVRSAVEAARNAFVQSLQDAQILLHVGREDFRVKGRFGAIAQVFANLFDNAIYWIGTEGAGGAIQVAVSAESRTVIVADSGPGVSEKMLEHLFEPFYSEKSPPSGLGLYICRHYLGQCDATIRLARPAERSKLRGAQFVLDFSKSPTGES